MKSKVKFTYLVILKNKSIIDLKKYFEFWDIYNNLYSNKNNSNFPHHISNVLVYKPKMPEYLQWIRSYLK